MVPRGKDGLLYCRFSLQAVQVLSDRLYCLASFLKEYLERRQQRQTRTRWGAAGQGAGQGVSLAGAGVGGGLFGGLGGGDAGSVQGQAAKRQRLTHAAALEDERTARIR